MFRWTPGFMYRSIFLFTIPLPGIPRVGRDNCGVITRVGMIYERDRDGHLGIPK